MGIVKCVVPGCEDRRSPRHRFPVFDQELYEEWLKRVGNVELLNLDPKYVGSNKRICSVHFSSHCRVPNSTKLKNRSLPTLQLPEFNEKPSEENSILKYPCRTKTISATECIRFEEVKRIPEDVKPILATNIDKSRRIDQISLQLNTIDPMAVDLTDTKTTPDTEPVDNTSEPDDDVVGFCEPVTIDFTYLMKITSLPDTPLIEESVMPSTASLKSSPDAVSKSEGDLQLPASNSFNGIISEAPDSGSLNTFDLDELISECCMENLADFSSHLIYTT